MSKFIEAVAKRTGRKQRIPAAWLDHPVIGEGFRQTPRDSARSTDSKRTAKKATAKKSASPSAASAADTTNAPVTGDKE